MIYNNSLTFHANPSYLKCVARIIASHYSQPFAMATKECSSPQTTEDNTAGDITEEQKLRMVENRKKALELKRKRLPDVSRTIKY